MSKFVKVKLVDITSNFDKLRIPLSSNERLLLEKKYPYYGAQSIVDYVDKYLFDGEYLLVAEDGENLRSQNSNVCNFVSGKFWVNNHAHILQAKDDNDLKYIFYSLNLRDFRPYVTGSAQPKLTQENLNGIELLIHHPDEQRRIAAVLSALDAKIELNNRINAELEAMAKTLYDYWFVQFDFPYDFSAGKPDPAGQPYKSSGGHMVWSEELKREVPEGWEVGSVSEITKVLARGISPVYTEGQGICVLNQKCIRNSTVDFSFARKHDESKKSAKSKLIEIGDILVNSTGVGTLGRTAIVKRLEAPLTTADSHVTIVRVNEKKASRAFIGKALLESQEQIEKLGEGSTGQTELSRENLGKLNILLPTSQIQEAYEEFYQPILDKIATLEAENQQLSQLRDWLLPMLMNGQVRV